MDLNGRKIVGCSIKMYSLGILAHTHINGKYIFLFCYWYWDVQSPWTARRTGRVRGRPSVSWLRWHSYRPASFTVTLATLNTQVCRGSTLTETLLEEMNTCTQMSLTGHESVELTDLTAEGESRGIVVVRGVPGPGDCRRVSEKK